MTPTPKKPVLPNHPKPAKKAAVGRKMWMLRTRKIEGVPNYLSETKEYNDQELVLVIDLTSPEEYAAAVVLVDVGNAAVGALPALLALVALPEHPEDHRLAEHLCVGEERLLTAIRHQSLEETAVHVGRRLGDGHREHGLFGRLFHPLYPQSGKVQIQHGTCQLGLRDTLFNA